MSKISDEDFIKKFRAFVSEIAPAPERNPTQNPIVGALYEVIDMVEARQKTEANPNGQFHNVEPTKPTATIEPETKPPVAATSQPAPETAAVVTLGPATSPATATPATSQPGEQKPGYHGVLIHGQIPAEPKSFFRTKKFKAIGVLIAVAVGVLSYFFIYA